MVNFHCYFACKMVLSGEIVNHNDGLTALIREDMFGRIH